MTTISAYLTGLEDRSQLVRQTDAVNQRDAWLRQMELAQLSEMNQIGSETTSGAKAEKGASKGALDAPSHSQSARRLEDAKRPSLSDTVPTSSEAAYAQASNACGAGMTINSARPVAGERSSVDIAGPQKQPILPAPSGRAPTALQAGGVAGDLRTQAASKAANASQTQALAMPADVGSGTDGGQALVPVGSPTATRIGEALALTSVQTVQAVAARPGSAQMPSVQQSVDMPVSQVARSGALAIPATPTLPNAANQIDATPTQDEVAPEEPRSDEAPSEEKPIWQKRLMHLTGEGDEVQLWIRDSELGTAQSQSLVYRLASDVASMGMRLRNATVNGKLAFEASDDNDTATVQSAPRAPRRSAIARNLGGDAPPAIDSTTYTPEQEHGTQ